MKKLFLTTGLLFAFVGLAQAELATSTLLKPDNTANLPLKKAAKFTWQKVTGASKYRLIFSNDKSFANYDAKAFKCLSAKTCFMYTVASPSYKLEGSHAMLKANGGYFWQVQSVGKKAADNSKMSEIRAFSVGTVPVTTGTTSSFYTKIANDGSTLSDDAKLGTNPTDWACTKDNKTGLIWEVKTTSGLRNMNNDYSWYEPDVSKNGGNAGKQNDGLCEGSECDTYAFANAVNAQGLCNANDWRMPTKDELAGLLTKTNAVNQPLNKKLYIDTNYFPNARSTFWSSMPSADDSEQAWLVDFFYDESNSNYKNYGNYILLVHG